MGKEPFAVTDLEQPAFSILGPVRAWCAGAELAIGPPQQRAALTMLLVRAGRGVSAEEMITGLWGLDAPEAARTSVRSYVSRLRSALRGVAGVDIVSRHGTYLLERPPGSLDLELVEQDVAAARAAGRAGDAEQARRLLRNAAARWRGTPLAGLAGPFVERQRARSVELQLSIIEERIRFDLQVGESAAAIAELGAPIAEHPLREGLRELLMRALYAAGRQADALAVFTDTRAVLIDRLGVGPGPGLTALHQQILRSDPALQPRTTEPRPQARSLPKPAQLPADLVDFVGREEQHALLATWLAASGTPPIVAISGVGGSGKTALALHVAHQMRDRFPDGQLYIDLAGVSDAPVEPSAALMSFLVALGVPAQAAPEDLAARSALLRSLLADRQVLLVLDNARTIDQVLPLLPGYPGCAAIVTSRSTLAPLTSTVVELESFRPDEAMQLMDSTVGAAVLDTDREVTARLLADVGHLPLAVRIIASQLLSRPGRRMPELARRYDDRQRMLGALHSQHLDVQLCFDLSYRQLSPRAAAAFRLLSWPETSTVSLSSAAALVGADEVETEELLDEVVDSGLLQSAAGLRYRFHDLVRLFAHQQLVRVESRQEIEAAADRLLDGIIGVLRAACQLVRPGHRLADLLTSKAGDTTPFADVAAAARWFTAEYDFLFAVFGKAVELAPEQVELAARMLLGMDPLLELAYGWHDVIAPARRLAERAGEQGLIDAEAVAWHMHSASQWEIAEIDTVLSGSAESARLCRLSDNPVLLAETETIHSMALSGDKGGELSRVASLRVLGMHERNANPSGAANILGNLGFIDHHRGRPVSSLLYFRRAAAIYRELGDEFGRAQMELWVGRTLLAMDRHAEAIPYLEDCLRSARRMHMRPVEASSIATIARVQLAFGRVAAAGVSAGAAVQQCRAFGIPRMGADAQQILDETNASTVERADGVPEEIAAGLDRLEKLVSGGALR